MKYPHAKVIGVDYSPLSLEKARERNKDMIASGRCELVEGDVSSLKFGDEKFSLATAFETIYFWHGLDRCFAEVRRVLKPGGYFVIVSESDGEDKPSLWFESIIDEMRTYTAQDIESALRTAGFSDIHTGYHPSHSWLVITSRK